VESLDEMEFRVPSAASDLDWELELGVVLVLGRARSFLTSSEIGVPAPTDLNVLDLLRLRNLPVTVLHRSAPSDWPTSSHTLCHSRTPSQAWYMSYPRTRATGNSASPSP